MRESLDERDGAEFSVAGLLASCWRALAMLVRRPSFAAAVGAPGGLFCARARLHRKGPAVRLQEGCESVSDAGVSNVHSVRFSLPRHLFLAKEILVPGTDEAEIAGMLGFEVAGLFPVALEELTWAWYPVEITVEGYTRARVVAIETAALEERLADAGLGGHSHVAAEPSTISLANYLCAALGGWPERPVAVVSLWDENVEFAVVGPKGLEFDRGTALPGPLEPADVAAEVAASLSIYRESARVDSVSRVLLFSSGPWQPLADALQREMDLPVEKAPTPSFIDAQEGPGSHAAICAGAVLGPVLSTGVSVSLAASRRLVRQKSVARAQALTFTVLLVALFVGLAWGALRVRSRRISRVVERLEARVEEIAPEADQIDAKRQRLAAVKKHLTGRSRVLQVLLELYRITPADISLTSLKLDKDALLTLRGQAQEIYRAHEYAQILEKSSLLGRSAKEGPESVQRTVDNKTYIDFKILRDLSETK